MFSVLQCLVDPVLKHFAAHLHLAVFACKTGCLDSSFRWIVWIYLRHGDIFAPLVLLRAKFEETPIKSLSSVLTVHVFAQLLGHNWDVFEALEGWTFGSFVDGG